MSTPHDVKVMSDADLFALMESERSRLSKVSLSVEPQIAQYIIDEYEARMDRLYPERVVARAAHALRDLNERQRRDRAALGFQILYDDAHRRAG